MALFSSDADHVRAAVEAWDPGEARSEIQCRNSLAEFLGQRFDAAEVVKEYGIGRLRADLRLKRTVGILRRKHLSFFELKYGFKTRSKLQRLIGQLHQYIEEKALPCFVVLCGECEENSIRELRSFIDKTNREREDLLSDDDTKVHLVLRGAGS